MLITTICEICNLVFAFEKLKPSRENKKTCSNDCSYKLRNKTRNTIHQSLEKICVDCKETFQDTSKKKQVTKCQSCINSNMVKTRKESGSYARTDAQNEKLSESLRKKYASGWNPNTEEQRKKNSEMMKKGWIDGTIPQKIKETSLKKYGVDHWTKTDKGKNFLSSINKGRKFSKDTRFKMSVSASKRVRDKRETLYTSARGGRREDLGGAYFRSCWEANFARILNHIGKLWQYEPESFIFLEGSTYTPDFLCEEVYYELKGRMTKTCEKKLSFMKLEYPHVRLELIDYAKYVDLRVRYKNLLPHWEGR